MTQAACRLAADDDDYGARPPLVLLHGLTFDRSLWRPSLAELRRIDPGRRVLALDLPGHGASPAWPSYGIESVAHGVHRAAEEARLRSPVVVGHSIAAVIATVYAARYPTRGIINVDQPLQVARFALGLDLIRKLALLRSNPRPACQGAGAVPHALPRTATGTGERARTG
jgi:pimeloyl-ACP methyl ester carboxylesterase